MKRILSIAAALSLGAAVATAETFTYDFGTGTGTFTTASTESTSFVPAAPSGQSRVRVGTGGGGFEMANPGDAAVGSGTELVVTAPTNTSANKFAISDYTAGKTGSVSFTAKMTPDTVTTSRWYFFAGDGASYTGGATFAGNQTFTGIRWTYGATSTIAAAVRTSGGAWSNNTSLNLTENTVYRFDIIMNNSASSVNYAHSSDAGPHALAANTWDIWINGSKVAGIGKAQLPDDSNIDSFMIYGEGNTGTVATIIIDDVQYSNDLLSTVPVELDLFQID
jgi:hypothetical protein